MTQSLIHPSSLLFLALEGLQHVEERAALRLALDEASAAGLERAQCAVERVVADLAVEGDGGHVRPPVGFRARTPHGVRVPLLRNLKALERIGEEVAGACRREAAAREAAALVLAVCRAQVLRRVNGADAATADDGDAVAEFFGLGEVVRGEQDGDGPLAARERADDGAHAGGGRRAGGGG